MTVTEVSQNKEGGLNIKGHATQGSPGGGPAALPRDRNLEARDEWDRKPASFRHNNPFSPVPNTTFLADNPSPFVHESSGTMDLNIAGAGPTAFVQKGSDIYIDIQEVQGTSQTDVDAESGRTLSRNRQALPANANADVRRGYVEQQAK
jgi:hypothetical protein